ncbi:MAG: aminotransferase class I/II-fold pyridoxal phosphate-dependent enzyme [Deltaproteobacteria bacterium]|nr:aminotransferase class I/II-fold pyridoxal phosphate-dependent enzyme [Deltaproteobacteria bacterium]
MSAFPAGDADSPRSGPDVSRETVPGAEPGPVNLPGAPSPAPSPPVSRETPEPLGAGASRLIHGTRAAHRALERELADWVKEPDALLFTSGYAANVGTIAALARPGDIIHSDALNHASLIDGCRLSRATIAPYPHRDLDALAQGLRRRVSGRHWVITESYFSMDGDSPDLGRIRALCDAHAAALVIDEAHALGVFGPEGAGLTRDAAVRADVLIGTLGKAVGTQGAFVAGSPELIRYLANRARSFVFSTAPSPATAAQSLDRVGSVRSADSARRALARITQTLAALLEPWIQPHRHGPIFPLLLGTPERALAAAGALRSQGFLTQAIRPPTVPQGTARLRITLKATHDPRDVHRLGQHLARLLGP